MEIVIYLAPLLKTLTYIKVETHVRVYTQFILCRLINAARQNRVSWRLESVYRKGSFDL